jgi:hypothetical protein
MEYANFYVNLCLLHFWNQKKPFKTIVWKDLKQRKRTGFKPAPLQKPLARPLSLFFIFWAGVGACLQHINIQVY